MNYRVTVLASARTDLDRLYEYLLSRELERDGDLDYPEQVIADILASLTLLEKFPFTCRKVEGSTFLRELVIPIGHSGYLALFEIATADHVLVSAIRHQREDDYH
ncbi:type II toxin-antitoxin system RelE/ParE family toxin [Pelomonas sp. KK5]|uniref:type II toxin-antitoxin system RelE/ParE family toxin n=1 Tax=Pelomonas sp. KK5 TaxID=1855730 RepID=UPI00097BEFC9|nr:type II toxin-antitoxin system RelE/ParE family toxin [Pelomonas sp. KK5]